MYFKSIYIYTMFVRTVKYNIQTSSLWGNDDLLISKNMSKTYYKLLHKSRSLEYYKSNFGE